MLLVRKGESSTLSCTTPCMNGSGTPKEYFYRPGDDQGKKDLYILKDSTLEPILSRVNFTSTGESCSYSLEISWTQDKAIRMELDSVYCLFLYYSDNIYLEPCRTAVIPVIFTDTGKCSVMQCSSVHVYCC